MKRRTGEATGNLEALTRGAIALTPSGKLQKQ
jgi:hypothetical protein